MKNTKSLKINAFLNAVKQMCSIIFPMITFPYATRVLGVYNFGKVNFGASIISYISLIAGLGISTYAIREGSLIKDNKEKLQLFTNQIFSINIISMSFSYLILFSFGFFWKRLENYKLLLLIRSMSVLFATLGTDWLNSIHEDYLYITIRYLLCQTLSVCLMFILVRSSEDYLLYTFTTVSATIMANFMNMIYVRKKYGIKPHLTWKCDFNRHLKPILILFATSIAAFIYVNSDITILGILRDERDVGIYSLAAKIYSLIKHLLNALLVVAIPRIGHDIAYKSPEEMSSTLETLIGEAIILISPAYVGLFMLSKQIIFIMSGVEYSEAVPVLQILSISLFFAILVTFYIYLILIPYKKEKIALYITTLSASINIVTNLILIPAWGVCAAALTTLISEGLSAFGGIFFVSRIVRVKIRKPMLIGCITAVSTFIVCYIVRMFNLSDILTVSITVICSVLLWSGICCLVYKEIVFEMGRKIMAKLVK